VPLTVVSAIGLTPAGSPKNEQFIPKLTDFGLAKWLDAADDSSKTKVGAMVGTPQYMAPEQTEHDSAAVCPATDVHGLGLILYELLAGRTPYLGDSLTDTLRIIQTAEPLPIRQQRPSVPRDLETICFKALEKEPSKRYANGRELADDLQRFLDGRPIVARPVSRAERVWKWCRRRPELAALWFVVIAALLTVSTGGWWFSVRISDSLKSETELRQSESKLLRTESQLRLDAERRERELAQRRDQLIKSVNAQRSLHYATDMQLAQQLYDAGKLRAASELLLTLRPSEDETDLRGFEWFLMRQLCGGDMQRLGDPNIEYWKGAMSPDRGVILASTYSGQFHLWDAHSLNPLSSIGLKPGSLKKSERIVQIAPLPSGDQWLFVTQNFDSNLPDATRLSLFDRRTQTEHVLGRAENWNSHRLEISPNGRLVVSFENFAGPKLFELPSGAAIPSPTFTPQAYRGFAFSPDGQEVAISDDNGVHVVTIASQSHRTIAASGQNLCNVTYSPKNDRLAALHFNGDVWLWKKSDAVDWQFDRKLPLPGGSDPERKWYSNWLGFEFSADGKRLAVARPDRRVVVWDFESDSVKFATRPLQDVANIVQFLPDDERLLLHDDRNFLHVWRPHSEQPQPAGHSREAWCVAFSPDGKLLASGSDDHTIKLWDVPTAREVATLNGHFATVSQIRFSPDGSRLASISLDGTLRLWDIATATQLNVVSAYKKGRTLGWSHDGRELVTGGYKDEGATVWDAESLTIIRSLPGHTRDVRTSLLSPDGRWIVTGSNDSTMRVTPRDSDTPQHLWTEQSEIHSALFVDDGQTIALGLKSGYITIRDVESGAIRHSLSSQTNDVRTLAMTADRKLLAAGDESGHLRFWNLSNGRLLLSLKASDHPINGIAFSPDGNFIAAATHDGQVKLWAAPRD
jgi:WD40 repeat protein